MRDPLNYIDVWPGDDRTNLISINPAYRGIISGLLSEVAYPSQWEGSAAEKESMVEKILELIDIIEEQYECPAGDPALYQLIDTLQVQSDSDYAEFTDIENTHSHLKLLIFSRLTVSGDVFLQVRFNGDSGNNYQSNLFSTSGYSSGAISALRLGYGTYANAPQNYYGSAEVNIYNYAAGYRKAVMWRSAACRGASIANLLNWFGDGIWSSTDVISSLRVFPLSNQLAANTYLELWAIG